MHGLPLRTNGGTGGWETINRGTEPLDEVCFALNGKRHEFTFEGDMQNVNASATVTRAWECIRSRPENKPQMEGKHFI